MAVDLCWLDEDETVLHYVFHDPWTEAEFSAANEIATLWMNRRDCAVDAVFDMSLTEVTLAGVPVAGNSALSGLYRGLNVVIGAARFADVQAAVVHRLLGGAPVQMASSIDAALAVLLRDQMALWQ